MPTAASFSTQAAFFVLSFFLFFILFNYIGQRNTLWFFLFFFFWNDPTWKLIRRRVASRSSNGQDCSFEI